MDRMVRDVFVKISHSLLNPIYYIFGQCTAPEAQLRVYCRVFKNGISAVFLSENGVVRLCTKRRFSNTLCSLFNASSMNKVGQLKYIY